MQQFRCCARRYTPAIVIVGLLLAGCGGGTSSQPASLTGVPGALVQAVASNNKRPTISGVPAVTDVLVGQAFAFSPIAADADGDTLTFSVANLPAWLQFNPGTGTLSGSPAAADVGSYANIVISVSDGKSTATGPAFSLTVKAAAASPPPASGPPAISGTPAMTVVAGQAYRFTAVAADPGGRQLTFSIANKPAWATFDSATGALAGTPAATNVGVFAGVTISISDGSLSASLPAFAITVTAAPVPPRIGGTPAIAVRASQSYAFAPMASDANGRPLTFAIAHKPAWATFNTVNGALTGTPAGTNVGSYAGITISVTDGLLSASLPAFTITVSKAILPPTISGTPATSVRAGTAYAFQPMASDPNGLPLTFSVANKPAWATFNSATAALTGTPASTDVGTFANVSIVVSNGTLGSSLAPFTITVQPATLGSATVSWQPPTLRADGTPLTNLAGFRIRYGTSAGSYLTVISVQNPGLTTYVIGNLPSGTYYFVATAYDSTGSESAYSAPASKTIT